MHIEFVEPAWTRSSGIRGAHIVTDVEVRLLRESGLSVDHWLVKGSHRPTRYVYNRLHRSEGIRHLVGDAYALTVKTTRSILHAHGLVRSLIPDAVRPHRFLPLLESTTIIVPGSWMRDELLERYPSIRRIEVVPNGVDPDVFYPAPYSARPVFGWVGPRTHNKGVDRLEALADRFDIRIAERVPHERMPAFWRSVDAGLMTSRSEGGQPLAILEAMASARPVIAFDIPAVRELLADGVNGYICSTIGEAIDRMSSLTPEEIERLGGAARETAGRYGWDRHVERLLAIYASM